MAVGCYGERYDRLSQWKSGMAVLDVIKDVEAWKQGLRTAVAGALSFILAEYFALPQGYWSVITAIMITQESMGATLQAVRDRLIGTFAGAVIGFLLAIVTPSGTWGTLIGLTVSIGWLAIFAARYPSLRIAPMTAAIMFIATPSHADVVVSAVHRVLEILLGCVVGVGVQLLVFPERAETLLRARVAQVLSLMAEFITADSDNSAAQFERKLHGAFGQMDKLAKQVQAEHFGRTQGSGLDADNVNHALRHLRLATSGLRRVTHRVTTEGDAAISAAVKEVNRSVQTYLLELSSEVNGEGTTADVGPMDMAFAQLSESSAAQLHKSAIEMSGDRIISFYNDAYEQIRMALNELRNAVFGTSVNNKR